MDLPQPSRPPTERRHRYVRTRRATLPCLACVLALTLLLGACAAPSTRFDPAAWKSQRGVPDEKNRRNDMAVAAREQLRVGMRREAVLAILGEPDSRKSGDTIDVYAVGASPLGIDSQYLELTYRDGRLVSFAITEA